MSGPLALTFASCGTSLAKTVHVREGKVIRTDDPAWPRVFSFETIEAFDSGEFLEVLADAARREPAPCILRAAPICDVGRRAIYDDAELGPAALRIVPRAWAGYDCDRVPAGDIDPLLEPERAVAKARQCLPPQHHDATVVWQLTASAGKRPDELRVRLWFLLERPLLGRQLAAWCRPAIEAHWLDPVTLTNEAVPHFAAVRVIGGPDPAPCRWGMITGERNRVPVPDHVLAMPERRYDGLDTDLAGDVAALKARLGPRFEQCRREAIHRIRQEVEAVRAAGAGSRHPAYMRAAARIRAICAYWDLPLDQARAKLEKAYLATLTPDEARKRDRGSTKGVWSWLERRTRA
jgi:hypothetical protein